MVRMKVFMSSTSSFEFSRQEKEMQNDQSEKGKARYQKMLSEHEKEYAPIENFIAEIGFENVRKITTTSTHIGTVVYTFFYEDNSMNRR